MVLHASIDLHLLVILVHLNRQGNWELKNGGWNEDEQHGRHGTAPFKNLGY